MATNLKKYLFTFIQLKKLGFTKKAIYRLDFSLLVFAVLVQVCISVLFIKIVYNHTNNIAGWKYPETLLVVANYLIIDGLLWMLFGQARGIMNHIRYGSLDGILIKPIDAQFLTSVWEGDLEDGVRIITGAAVMFYGLNLLKLPWNILIVNGIFYFFLLFNATLIAYSIVLITKTLSFWVVGSNSLFNLSESIINASQFPTDIFLNSVLRIFFTIFLPVAFIATIPAKILARGFDWKLVLGSCVVTIIFFTLARKFWLYALKRYQSASS